MKKTYTLLNGETILLNELDKAERRAIRELLKRTQKDADGDGEGNFFALWRLCAGPDALLLKYRGIFSTSTLNDACFRVMRDIANRTGLRQGVLLDPKFADAVARFAPNYSVISFDQAARGLGLTYRQTRKLLEEGDLAGEKIGNVWVVSLASFAEYKKRQEEK